MTAKEFIKLYDIHLMDAIKQAKEDGIMVSDSLEQIAVIDEKAAIEYLQRGSDDWNDIDTDDVGAIQEALSMDSGFPVIPIKLSNKNYFIFGISLDDQNFYWIDPTVLYEAIWIDRKYVTNYLDKSVTIMKGKGSDNILSDDYPYDVEVKAMFSVDGFEFLKRAHYHRIFFCLVNGDKYKVTELYMNNNENYSGMGKAARVRIRIEKVDSFYINELDSISPLAAGTLEIYTSPNKELLKKLEVPEICGHNYLYYTEKQIRLDYGRTGLDLFGIVDPYWEGEVEEVEYDDDLPDEGRIKFFNEFLAENF